jgi:hypothetical protein
VLSGAARAERAPEVYAETIARLGSTAVSGIVDAIVDHVISFIHVD